MHETGRPPARLLCLISAAALVLLAAPGVVDAQAPDAPPAVLREVPITVTDGRIAARLSPVPAIITDDSAPNGVVRVDNVSGVAETVQIGLSDYVLRDGEPVPAPDGYPYGSASWYRFEATAFPLPAGTGRELQFTVHVPVGAAAGDHIAALSVLVRAASEPAPANVAGPTVRTQLLLQTRLQHRIPGAHPESPSLRLTAAVGWDSVHFVANVANSGNTLLSYQVEPLARLEMHETSPWASGTTVLTMPRYYVPPKSEQTVAFDWTNLPLIGFFRAEYVIPPTDGLPEVRTAIDLTVVNVPLLLGILGALAGLVALVIAISALRGRRRRLASLS